MIDFVALLQEESVKNKPLLEKIVAFWKKENQHFPLFSYENYSRLPLILADQLLEGKTLEQSLDLAHNIYQLYVAQKDPQVKRTAFYNLSRIET